MGKLKYDIQGTPFDILEITIKPKNGCWFQCKNRKVLNVANVKMLPVTNFNPQLETGERWDEICKFVYRICN